MPKCRRNYQYVKHTQNKLHTPLFTPVIPLLTQFRRCNAQKFLCFDVPPCDIVLMDFTTAIYFGCTPMFQLHQRMPGWLHQLSVTGVTSVLRTSMLCVPGITLTAELALSITTVQCSWFKPKSNPKNVPNPFLRIQF